MTNNMLPPVLVFILGAVLIPFLKGKVKAGYMLALPVVVFITLLNLSLGNTWIFEFWGYELIMGRIDKLSLIFAYVFTIMAFLGILFALHVKDNLQHVSGLVYAGSTLGVVLAGDFLSLYIFWEIMAVSSTFLIIASRTKESREAGFRYILVHLIGGLFLLAGIVLYIQKTNTIAFDYIGLGGIESYLIFIGIALNAAAVPLHAWLPDAYPMGTPTSTVFLSAFTTKSAVYLLIRTFPGADILLVIGALMVSLPIFYAVLENDIRRVLSYSLMNQVGFMLVGIGIGTELALNGAVAHAFCHIIYKALLFMAAGSVLQMTGKIKCTEIGGLYKTMPLTCLFCMIGAASISAFPLFSGFVSKSMIISASGKEQIFIIWLVLQFASTGVVDHAGIKVPFFTFFGHDSGIRAKEPPLNMLLAMGIAAFLCIGLGVFYKPLYNLLPFAVHYEPYTGAHVIGQLQLLMFGALAFTLLILSGYYVPEVRSKNIDADWTYRKFGSMAYKILDNGLNLLNRVSEGFLIEFVKGVTSCFKNAATGISLFVFVNFWLLIGYRDKRLEIKKQQLYNDVLHGILPIGISAGVAVSFIFLMYVWVK
ncbi:MAG: Na(+)/H(+) antiporter subunit D [Proteobacteria bacterium]|nr:Na(+)/H(+) antiporter subunit D [Pseudomonadota bacterium]MBU1386605.1 Na(+)/H(+) antiporter subunit D [Pseudomonadota bacterium]MBU1542506.1 Na(+)/H(+) antiporter subunit D [Pseudomonadota bacterium]MBU2431270.1 Na(+)/H(+) antiporter subunit D [Pseudomonadota bacterium]MBU2481536.1 Na(+)/H(+) antiporter subunit D [Pseudomonadota bacterium]